MVALSLAVYDHTHSALAVSALLVAAQVVPAFAVPALVARVEASPRRGELSSLYFFECAVTAGLAVLLWHFWLPGVLFLVALDGIAALAANALLRTEAARAARRGVAPDAPGREEREQAAEQGANAAINIAFSATFVLGPAAGGALVAGTGASFALFLDAASFLLCGALLLDVRPHVEDAGGPSVTARLRAAWTYINEVPALRSLLLVQAFALIFFESAGPIEVAFAKSTLHAGDRGYGVFIAAWGVGVVLGSILFARSRPRSLGTMLVAGTFAVGLAYLGFAAAPSLGVACAAAVLGGIGNGVQWAPLVSALQRLTPPNLQGRVMGALESIGALCPAIGLSLGGALVALDSPRFAFLIVGAGAVISTIGFMRISLDSRAPERAASGEALGRAPSGAADGAGAPGEHAGTGELAASAGPGRGPQRAEEELERAGAPEASSAPSGAPPA